MKGAAVAEDFIKQLLMLLGTFPTGMDG